MTDHFTTALPDSCFLNRYFCDHSGPHYAIVFFLKIPVKKPAEHFSLNLLRGEKYFHFIAYEVYNIQLSGQIFFSICYITFHFLNPRKPSVWSQSESNISLI